jgi:copper transport protein
MRRLALGGLLAGALIVVFAAPASAHALLRSSDPANGAALKSAPARVVLDYTQPVDLGLAVVNAVNQAGQAVSKGPVAGTPGKPTEVSVALLPNLPKGTYTVTWRMVSKLDGHVTAGSISFGVGEQPKAPSPGQQQASPATPAPSALYIAARWLFYAGLLLLFGFAIAGTFVWRNAPAGTRAYLWAAWGIAALGVVLMTVAEASSVGVSLGVLLRSQAGGKFVQRGVAVLVVGVAVTIASFRPRWTSLPLIGLTVSGAMLVDAIAGHASETAPAWLNVGAEWFHIMAVGVWIGGLGWLALSLRRREDPDRPRLVKRFSVAAGFALLAVAVTGLIRALDEIGPPQDWGRLFTTAYGITLLVKIVLFGGLVTLGALNHYRHVPAMTGDDGTHPRRLRRNVRGELGIAGAILVATAVLSGLTPSASLAEQQQGPPTPTVHPVVVTGHDFATTVRVRLTVTPGTVGPNRFRAVVTDYDSGRPAPASAVTLQFSLKGHPELGQPTLPLRRGGAGTWTGSGTVISLFGRWTATAQIQGTAGGVEVPMELTPNLPRESVQTIPGSKGQPTLYQITLPGGRQLQTYVDPGSPGKNTVHFTFFDLASGNELSISQAQAMAVEPNGAVRPLKLIRFDKGHFAANTSLSPGTWKFLIDATQRGGAPVSGWFGQDIG